MPEKRAMAQRFHVNQLREFLTFIGFQQAHNECFNERQTPRAFVWIPCHKYASKSSELQTLQMKFTDLARWASIISVLVRN